MVGRCAGSDMASGGAGPIFPVLLMKEAPQAWVFKDGHHLSVPRVLCDGRWTSDYSLNDPVNKSLTSGDQGSVAGWEQTCRYIVRFPDYREQAVSSPHFQSVAGVPYTYLQSLEISRDPVNCWSASNQVFNARILGFRNSPRSGGPGVQSGRYNNPPL
jgi:hypothetical protein